MDAAVMRWFFFSGVGEEVSAWILLMAGGSE